ncbi:TRAM domain-containing protein [archaeon]|nr:TRAM domain-containing protein [archaeon]
MYGRNRSSGYGGGFPPRAPVNVGDEFEVTVESVAEKGDGVAKKDGFVLFVPNTKQGDKVKVKVTKVLRKFAFAEVVGEGSAPSEESSEESSEEQSEESQEDSEDFGEDLEE